MPAAARIHPPPDASNGTGVVLRASGLCRRYREGEGELTVFSNLNLEVEAGQMVAIVGESGCGKSTLLHLLSGLDTPSSGDVYFDSTPLSGMGEGERSQFRNREVGFVWQQPYLLPEFTARENVMMPLMIAGRSAAQAAPAAQGWLDQVGVGARADHRAGEISGGEQQRVALARALASQPRFLMADEPTGNLDEATGAAVFHLLRDLHTAHGLTSIVVTHNRRHAALCDRVLQLHAGQLQELVRPVAAEAENHV